MTCQAIGYQLSVGQFNSSLASHSLTVEQMQLVGHQAHRERSAGAGGGNAFYFDRSNRLARPHLHLQQGRVTQALKVLQVAGHLSAFTGRS